MQRVPLSNLNLPLFSLSVPPLPLLSSRTVQRRRWTGTSAAPCATCSSPLPSWPSPTTRGKPTPRESVWSWGNRPAPLPWPALPMQVSYTADSAATARFAILTDKKPQSKCNESTFSPAPIFVVRCLPGEKAVFSSKHIFLSDIDLGTSSECFPVYQTCKPK